MLKYALMMRSNLSNWEVVLAIDMKLSL